MLLHWLIITYTYILPTEKVCEDRVSVDRLIDTMRQIMVNLANKKYEVEVTKLELNSYDDGADKEEKLNTIIEEYNKLHEDYENNQAHIKSFLPTNINPFLPLWLISSR